ncbi:MAG: FAD-dependent oxidoreductase [Chitinophagaceae bacterium]
MHRKHHSNRSDVIIIGAGSGGLSVGLFLAKVGIKVTMIVKSDKDVGGECLNDGCVPSKAFIHVARQMQAARETQSSGISLSGELDIQKAIGYVHARQEIIRKHEYPYSIFYFFSHLANFSFAYSFSLSVSRVFL